MSDAASTCIAVVCIFVAPLAVSLLFGLHSLHATEWGLDYNAITENINPEPYDAGLHWLGIGHSFIKFPNTYQNMQFSSSEHDLLHTRTSDGLPLTLGLSFQYTLARDQLYHIYMKYKLGYHDVLFNVATHIIAETACNYTAYNFFNDKQSIANQMQKNLNEIIPQYMHLRVETLQILLVKLPSSFEDAILESVNTKQNIIKTKKQYENQAVSFQTKVMAAQQSANQTVTLAEGQAKQILLTQEAAAEAITQTIDAEALAYARMKEAMKFTNQELLQFIWYDTMGDSKSDSQFIVGMDPQTYIQSKGS